MSQGNFLKVVDTLEKYQQRVVNTQSESGKEFILFKRQLYQMYEVQSRSIDEHEYFSTQVERQNLAWLYQANIDYNQEMQRVTFLDNLVNHGQLKGSIFKAKMLSARRLKGLGSFTLAGFAYMHLTSLSLMLGPTAPMLAIVALTMNGAKSFLENGMVSRIDYITEGEFKGLIRVNVATSPFVSKSVIINPKHTMSLCSVGGDDVGEEDADGNILFASEYMDESTGQPQKNGVFTLPADSHRDRITLEWIMARKDEASETDALFNDLIQEKHMEIASTGGLSGIKALTAKSTGYADFGDEEELAVHLKNDSEAADETLRIMADTYGKEELEKMKPSEFYRLYRDFSLGKL